MKKIFFISLCLLLQNALAYNPQHLNQLIATCSCPHCDLSHANLTNFILGDAKTLVVQRANHDTSGAIICNLTGANFEGAKLNNAYFSPADFGPGIHPQVAIINLTGASFNKASLIGAHFNAVRADNSSFAYANLSQAKILKHASFKNANFKGAFLKNISVSPPMGGCGAYFTGSNFSYANLATSKINADFTQANFSYANLSDAQLATCDSPTPNIFIGTVFFNANLNNTIINREPANEQLLSHAKLCRTRFVNQISNRDCK